MVGLGACDACGWSLCNESISWLHYWQVMGVGVYAAVVWWDRHVQIRHVLLFMSVSLIDD